jgi:hypothetical protein
MIALENQIALINKQLMEAIESDNTALLNSLNATKRSLIKERKEVSQEIGGGQSEKDAAEQIKTDIRAWLADRDYSYVLANDRFWLRNEDGSWLGISDRALQKERAGLRDGIENSLFLDVLKEDGRWFDRCTYTFKKCPKNVLNMLNLKFCPRVDDGQEVHWLLDMLIGSIGGGKAENIEHIEKLIVAKYLHPENVMLPALVLQDGGGTGKGMLVSNVLMTLFGRTSVADNLKIADVCGKAFNAALEGKAVWYINEAARGRYSLDDLKIKIGSKTFWVEHKGINAFECDMTALVIISGNDSSGAVQLSHGGVDRRWSVVKGGKPIKTALMARLGCSEQDAGRWLTKTGEAILNDAVEVGRWINGLIARHGDVDQLDALHGDDYAALAETQASIEDRLFDALFLRDPDFSHIKRSTLYDLYLHFARGASRTPKARGTLYADLTSWAERNDVGIAQATRKLDGGRNASKVDLIVAGDAPARPVDNDSRYIDRDDHGYRVIRVDIG